jgi:PKHD-type hydroxylase
MTITVDQLLTPAEYTAIARLMDSEIGWASGVDTAKGQARAAKENLQAVDCAASKGAIEKVRRSILAAPIVRAAVAPAQVARILLSRYETGMAYGPHVDAPFIDDCRTDVSFTLFLSAPEDYDGGELVIDAAGSVDTIKLPAGGAVFYPSTSVHEVRPVTRGVRHAAVGWIKSRLSTEELREMYFELTQAIEELDADGQHAQARLRLVNLRNNFLRRFGE